MHSTQLRAMPSPFAVPALYTIMNIRLTKIFTLIIILIFYYSCSEKEKSNLTAKHSENNDSLEISVINQTLSILKEGILFNRLFFQLPGMTQKDIIQYEFEGLDEKILFERLKYEKIDTSEVNLVDISFLVFPDSLSEFENLKPRKLNLSSINKPNGTIIISKGDSILNDEFRPISINISRVKFNNDKTKAKYMFEIFRGLMNASGFIIHCEFRNGAWMVVKKEMTWIS